MSEKGKAKSEFWWATIAGADAEPVEVTTLDRKRVAYTCGCGDPFYLDEPDCPCVLIPVFEYRGDGLSAEGPIERVLTPAQEKLEEDRQRRRDARLRAHAWRGPR